MAARNSNFSIKSSLYQPVGSTLFRQLITEQHMNNHYRLIDSAKSKLDNKTPKSEAKKKKNSNNSKSSRPSSRLSQLSSVRSCCGTSFIFQDDVAVRNAMCIKGKNTKVDPLNGLKVSDKVALYIDVMQPKIEEHDKYLVQHKDHHLPPSSIASTSLRSNHKNVDVMDSYAFTKPKPFVPRLKANNRACSMLSQSRCYNPPVKKNIVKRKKKRNQHNEHSDSINNDSFHHKRWLNEQAKKAIARQRVFKNAPDQTPDSAYNDSFKTISHEELNSLSSSNRKNNSKTQWSDENEESRYLEFVFEITEDIISRGIFTNRVLKQVLKSRILQRKDDLDMSKMNALINQLREDLGIPNGDDLDELEAGLGSTSDVLNKQTGILDMFSFNDSDSNSFSVQNHSKSSLSKDELKELIDSSEHSQNQFDTLKKLEDLSLNSDAASSIKSESSESSSNSHVRKNGMRFQSSDSDNSSKIILTDTKDELIHTDTEKSLCSHRSTNNHKKSEKSFSSITKDQTCSSLSDSQTVNDSDSSSDKYDYSEGESFESDAENS